jgi:hypothetical protein
MKPYAAFSALAFTALLAACQSNVKQEGDAVLTFDSLRIDTICHISADTASPACTFCLKMQYPVSAASPELLSASEAFIVKLMFRDEYSGMHPIEAAQRYRDDYLANYRSDSTFLDYYDSDADKAVVHWLNYDECLEGEVLYVSDRFLSYSIRNFSYTGGAHGNGTVRCSVLDLNTSCPLFLSDLFPEGALSDVSELMRQQLLSDRGFTSFEQLCDEGFYQPNEIDVVDNFYIDERGITWQYSPYEIAAYYCGYIAVTLTWDQVYPYLLDDSPLISMAQAADSTATL